MRRFARDHELTDNQEGKCDPDYLAEVETQTARRVSQYEAAERRLAAAHKRHASAKARAEQASQTASDRNRRQSEIAAAWALVEERLRELRVLEALMTETPAGRNHRGTGNPKHRS